MDINPSHVQASFTYGPQWPPYRRQRCIRRPRPQASEQREQLLGALDAAARRACGHRPRRIVLDPFPMLQPQAHAGQLALSTRVRNGLRSQPSLAVEPHAHIAPPPRPAPAASGSPAPRSSDARSVAKGSRARAARPRPPSARKSRQADPADRRSRAPAGRSNR